LCCLKCCWLFQRNAKWPSPWTHKHNNATHSPATRATERRVKRSAPLIPAPGIASAAKERIAARLHCAVNKGGRDAAGLAEGGEWVVMVALDCACARLVRAV
jgi:hypothetical protein